MVNTAVLFETFARPEYAIPAFQHIKNAQPSKLYFYSNKAREDRPDEIARNEEIRSLIKQIDWPCELHCFFREKYVDIYTSLRGAMDWVFENEERAIILEEDCIASPSFFEYCDYFLDKYEDNHKIAFITGDNYIEDYNSKGADHIINRTFFMYGWATWRNRWNAVDVEITVADFLAKDYIGSYYDDSRMIRFWRGFYKKISNFVNTTHCWDYVFCMNCMKNNQYGVSPIVNLITNVGAYGEHSNGESGSNTYKKIYMGESYPFSQKNVDVVPSKDYDKEMFEKYYGHMLTMKYRIHNTVIPMIKSITRKILGKTICSTVKKFWSSKI